MLHRAATLLTLFLFPAYHYAQWHTSTNTDSALSINYGLVANVQTFDDGSSIFCHGLDNTIYLQRFDERGYRVWNPSIVVAHDNPASDYGGGAAVHSDGAKGVIMLWADHRGAYFNPSTGQYANSALYIQKADSNGIVRWAQGGILVSPPLNGQQGGKAVPDGQGGTIIFWIARGFDYPNAPNRDELRLARFNASGQRLWETLIDSSSTRFTLFYDYANAIVRAGRKIYVGYYRYNPELDVRVVVDIVGTRDTVWNGFYSSISWKDSILFSLSASSISPPRILAIKKISNNGQELWRTTVAQLDTSCTGAFRNVALVADDKGGVFFHLVCNDSIFHIDGTGVSEQLWFAGVRAVGGYAFRTGSGGIVAASDAGLAQRYDSVGTRMWGPSPIVYQTGPSANFKQYWGDYKGGIIVTFWTPNRGLSAQHTGRYGRPGVVPVREGSKTPESFTLYQNYPNPFNARTIIEYILPSRARLRLRVLDILGRIVSELVPHEEQDPGSYQIAFDASAFSSGVYFYQLESDSYRQTKRMVLLR
jgi:hypothetical protein